MIIWGVSLLCTLPLLLLLWCCVMAVPERSTAYYKPLRIGNWQVLEFFWKNPCLDKEAFCLSANAFWANPKPKSIERSNREISTIWNQVSGGYIHTSWRKSGFIEKNSWCWWSDTYSHPLYYLFLFWVSSSPVLWSKCPFTAGVYYVKPWSFSSCLIFYRKESSSHTPNISW